MGVVRIARIHDRPAVRPGELRILVDRLWPRGVSRAAAKLDEWLPDLGPTDGLRKWFGHEPDRFAEFRRRYRAQLRTAARTKLLAKIAEVARQQDVVLLFGAKDPLRNQAAVILDELARRHGVTIEPPEEPET